jgi:hypothetical protein
MEYCYGMTNRNGPQRLPVDCNEPARLNTAHICPSSPGSSGFRTASTASGFRKGLGELVIDVSN